ncbi:hypothetical protein LTR49_027814 [Elasticomyces elasticus]|nr:hypothetical protein LTR49_027814 [Elasticomyces elasticus]KAK5734788.1 hypothetical protein LTS12_026631 [Elasticomyces elasticus]
MESHLTKDQFDSPFTKAERALESALLKNDVKHINGGKDSVKKRVEAILVSTYEAPDRLDDREVDDPKERKAMKALQKILGKLEETYRAVGEKLSEVKGSQEMAEVPGMTKRSVTKIKAHLSKQQVSSPFSDVARSLLTALNQNDASHTRVGEQCIQQRVRTMFNDIGNSFERLIDKTIEDPRETRARQALQAMLPGLEEDFRNAIDMLNQIKGRF